MNMKTIVELIKNTDFNTSTDWSLSYVANMLATEVLSKMLELDVRNLLHNERCQLRTVKYSEQVLYYTDRPDIEPTIIARKNLFLPTTRQRIISFLLDAELLANQLDSLAELSTFYTQL